MRVLLAIRTESEANLRENWHVKAKRVRMQRQITRVMVGQELIQAQETWRENAVHVITLTRIAPRPLDDDNLPRSFKAIRDGVADALGRDDRVGSGLEWKYAQEKGPPKRYAVRIEIEANGKNMEGQKSYE
jgi:hypothetical protein